MKVKICGITNRDDALNAANLGADALGFIFYPQSPRYVTPEVVEDINLFLPPFISTVGVFVNQDIEEIKEISKRCRLDVIQLHGEESPSDCLALKQRVIKAFRVSGPEDIQAIPEYQGCVSSILLDTKVAHIRGGTGQSFDWGLAIAAKEYDVPLILSGGINESNIKKAMALVKPYGIDVSSGVEKEPGIKDYEKVRRLLQLTQ